MEAGIVRNDSKQNTNGSCSLAALETVHTSLMMSNDVTRSADALTGAPALVPIGMHDQERSLPVNESARS